MLNIFNFNFPAISSSAFTRYCKRGQENNNDEDPQQQQQHQHQQQQLPSLVPRESDSIIGNQFPRGDESDSDIFTAQTNLRQFFESTTSHSSSIVAQNYGLSGNSTCNCIFHLNKYKIIQALFQIEMICQLMRRFKV